MLVYVKGINEDLKNMATFGERQNFSYFLIVVKQLVDTSLYTVTHAHIQVSGHEVLHSLAPLLSKFFCPGIESPKQGKECQNPEFKFSLLYLRISFVTLGNFSEPQFSSL